MVIRFKCLVCGKTLSAPDGYGGKRVRCKHCNGVITVPARTQKTKPSLTSKAEKLAPAAASRPGRARVATEVGEAEDSVLAGALSAESKEALRPVTRGDVWKQSVPLFVGPPLFALMLWGTGYLWVRLAGMMKAPCFVNAAVIIVPLGLIVCAIVFLFGVGRVIFSLLKGRKSVRCPHCGSERRVFSSVESFICDCGKPIILAPEQSRVLSGKCPYCNLEIAFSEARHYLNCPNCTLSIMNEDGMLLHEDERFQPCPKCRSRIPLNVNYCESCMSPVRDTWISSLQEKDKYARCRTAKGYFAYARLLRDESRKYFDSLPEKYDDTTIDAVKGFDVLLASIGKSSLYWEASILRGLDPQHVLSSLPTSYRFYSSVLSEMHRRLGKVKMYQKSDALSRVVAIEHVERHNSLLRTLQSRGIASDIPEWHKELIQVREPVHPPPIGLRTGARQDDMEIVSIDGLLDEVARIAPFGGQGEPA